MKTRYQQTRLVERFIDGSEVHLVEASGFVLMRPVNNNGKKVMRETVLDSLTMANAIKEAERILDVEAVSRMYAGPVCGRC